VTKSNPTQKCRPAKGIRVHLYKSIHIETYRNIYTHMNIKVYQIHTHIHDDDVYLDKLQSRGVKKSIL
jgi:hypothetical protein